ncbi:hypothetical protein MUK42_07074 [Musa troglodytarum]|uniref:Uncharacterized protein n=1 Tax=Musa troglodytarum TaxID=320322 RepID=A0A9E7HL89_9LILI|nr:hypothetical protein MUK42_07074 [Musa troglodytarum]
MGGPVGLPKHSRYGAKSNRKYAYLMVETATWRGERLGASPKAISLPHTEAKERRKRRKRRAQGREVMVGIFSRFSGGYMAKPSHHPSLLQLDKKLAEVSECEEEEGNDGIYDAHGEIERKSDGDDDDDDDGAEVEVDGDFKPIKHPLEPPDDDRPAKYPLPFASVDEGELKEPFTASLQTAAESSSIGKEGRVAEQTRPRTDRKRHPVRNHPPPPSPNYSIFQVFHQCKQFEA